MAKNVTVTYARTHLYSLLDDVESGETIVLTKRGRVVAVLEPARPGHRLMGMFKGVVTTNASDDELFSTGAKWNCE
jgi:prevent-host-death family protein